MIEKRNIPSRPVLGKGLASLLPGAAPMSAQPPAPVAPQSDTNKDRHPGISLAAIDEIAPNPFQPRRNFDEETIQELATSIRANGLIQPLIVRKNQHGKFELIAGERRLRASKLAGLKQVPVVIRRSTDKESLELALIENIQREDLNCIDTALSYYQLIHDFDLTQEELSARVGKDRATVANHLRLLKLPQSVQIALRETRLSFGHGRALAALEDAAQIERIAKMCLEAGWSVRELETKTQAAKAGTVAREKAVATEPHALRVQAVEKELAAKLGTRVSVKGGPRKGKITIEYFSPEDLERILSHLMR